MKIIDPSYEILSMDEGNNILRHIELAGRTCYKSEARITANSADDFVRRIIANGHHSVLEHASATVRIICDRGVSHELVRHRIGIAISQESTRYCRYGTPTHEITFIRPPWWDIEDVRYQFWKYAMKEIEYAYGEMLKHDATPQEARSVLPNSLKTEVVITANMREWRHILSLRCSKAAHPQMRQIMIPLLKEMHSRCPIMFEDIICKVKEDA